MASPVWMRAIAWAALVLGAPATALAQSSGGTSTSSASTSTGGTFGRITSPSTGNANPTPSQSPAPTRTILLTGRVMLEDGTPPAQPATLVTVCGGATHSEGYTDSKGYFAIELGAQRAVVDDASEVGSRGSRNMPSISRSATPGGMGGNNAGADRRYMGCEFQAKLGGYRSQSIALTGRRPMDAPEVGTILLHRTGTSEDNQTVSMVSLAAPKDARRTYEKGLDALKKMKYQEAQASFEKAVEAYPKYAAAWYELGMLQAGQSNLDMARKYFNEALESDPRFVRPYYQIALLELRASHWSSLADATGQVIALDSFDYPQAFYYNAAAHFNLREMAAAEKSARAGERLDTRNEIPRLRYLLGLILLAKRDYPAAAEEFRTYLKAEPEAKDAAKVRSQLAELDKVTSASAAVQEP